MKIIARVQKQGYRGIKYYGYSLYESDNTKKTGYRFVKTIYKPLPQDLLIVKGQPKTGVNAP